MLCVICTVRGPVPRFHGISNIYQRGKVITTICMILVLILRYGTEKKNVILLRSLYYHSGHQYGGSRDLYAHLLPRSSISHPNFISLTFWWVLILYNGFCLLTMFYVYTCMLFLLSMCSCFGVCFVMFFIGFLPLNKCCFECRYFL